MNNKKIPLVVSSIILLAALACSFFGGQPQAQEPTSSVYATAVSAGGVHTCALLNNGKVKCWGSNDTGQFGDGTYVSHNTAVEIPGLSEVLAISAGGEHTCALLSNGEVKCWGKNTSGQLGDGTKQLQSYPVIVAGLTNAVAISAGGEHTCAILKDGKAKCWGKNLDGRVGDGSNTRLILSPIDVAGLTDSLVLISAGYEHTCAVTSPGSIKCWGKNDMGQVGDDTTRNRKIATDVIALDSGIKSVSTGYATSCVATEYKNVLCWGWIGHQDYYTSPQEVAGLESDIVTVAAGASHICGLTSDGIVKCLGDNEYGQLGSGDTNPLYSAKNVNGLGRVISLSAGFNHTCALLDNGKIFCWGQNVAGALGNGTDTDSSTPVEVIGLIE